MKSTRVFSSKSRSKKTDTTTITFVLLKEDREELLKIAEEFGLTISGICREALQDYVKKVRSADNTNSISGA